MVHMSHVYREAPANSLPVNKTSVNTHKSEQSNKSRKAMWFHIALAGITENPYLNLDKDKTLAYKIIISSLSLHKALRIFQVISQLVQCCKEKDSWQLIDGWLSVSE